MVSNTLTPFIIIKSSKPHPPLTPHQNPPPPPLQHLEILFINILLAPLHLRAQPLELLPHRPRNPQRHLILKHIHHRKHKKRQRRQPRPVHRPQDACHERLALEERVLGVIGRSPAHIGRRVAVLGPRPAEEDPHQGDEGGAGSVSDTTREKGEWEGGRT